MVVGYNATVSMLDVEKALAPLKDLDKRIRKRVLAKVARAGGAEQLKVLKQLIPRKRGLARRSSKTKLKSYSGTSVAISGQQKGKEYKKSAKGRHHTGLSGKGYPVPFHLLDTRVRPHFIPGRINRMGFQTRGKATKGLRNAKPLALPGKRFAWRVRHPGMPKRDLLSKAHLQSLGSAIRHAVRMARYEIAQEVEAARRMSTWD